MKNDREDDEVLKIFLWQNDDESLTFNDNPTEEWK